MKEEQTSIGRIQCVWTDRNSIAEISCIEVLSHVPKIGDAFGAERLSQKLLFGVISCDFVDRIHPNRQRTTHENNTNSLASLS